MGRASWSGGWTARAFHVKQIYRTSVTGLVVHWPMQPDMRDSSSCFGRDRRAIELWLAARYTASLELNSPAIHLPPYADGCFSREPGVSIHRLRFALVLTLVSGNGALEDR